MLALYKKYFEGSLSLNELERQHLFRFLHEMIGCVNLQWKDASLTGLRYSEVVTQSDETMGFYVLKYYDNIVPENGREGAERKQKLSGKRLRDAMLWFNEQSKELVAMKKKFQARKQQLDIDLCEYIRKQMKWQMNGLGNTTEMPSLTKQRRREELNNLHDFTKLFGRNGTIDSIVGQREEV